ncbi:MAG: HAD-IB family hydrolase [Nanoarchaeota archaeon]|nr:HAD-IB family hydrolase [Nanoarchaeota archaeon]
MNIEKIAFCDFDGTLSQGYISMDFMDYLFKENLYAKESYEKQMQYFKETKTGKLSYDAWCEKWGQEWANGLKGQDSNLIQIKSSEFFHNFKQNIYDSSYGLMNYLKQKGYTLLLISAGAYEVVSLAALELGMYKAYSTKNHIENNIYTGKLKTNIHLLGGKRKKIKNISDTKKIPLENCIAMGDSISDIEMLELVGIPIVLNPSLDLFDFTKEKKWTIFKHNNILEEIKKLLN